MNTNKTITITVTVNNNDEYNSSTNITGTYNLNSSKDIVRACSLVSEEINDALEEEIHIPAMA